MTLTKRQSDLLSFIEVYAVKHGCGPTYDEVRVALGLGSKSGVARLVDGLVERGRLRRMPNLARALEVVRPSPEGAVNKAAAAIAKAMPFTARLASVDAASLIIRRLRVAGVVLQETR